MAKHFTHQCKICGTKFTSETAAHKHVAKRHANGALWVEGNKSLWVSESDLPYMLVCEDHSSCVDLPSKTCAMDWARNADTAEFCEDCMAKVGA